MGRKTMHNHEELKIDFANLGDLEIRLIDMAHEFSMQDSQYHKTMGRCLKHLAPSFIEFIRQEALRDEELGPGMSVAALVKNYAFLTYLLLSSTARNPKMFKEGVQKVIGLFAEAFNNFAETSTVEKPRDPVWNENETTVH
jgi:hypothetical protein